MHSVTSYALAVDVGGTFTDAVLISSAGGCWTDKALTTHNDIMDGFFAAADLVLKQAGIPFSELDDVITHATTVITNLLIERKGGNCALITTQGFTDVLYIRDEHRYDMFDPQIEYPEPLIPKSHTYPVKERVSARGQVISAVDDSQVRRIARDISEREIESVAVCLLNSYANGVNERRVKQILEKEVKGLQVTLSSDIAPQIREYPRTSTTSINAYATPFSLPYLNSLTDQVRERGSTLKPLIMLSNGGVIGAATAALQPVRMIESGPAAGALAASLLSKTYGVSDLISFDMGGTTAKACLIQGGEPLITGEFEVDRRYRFKPGSGMPTTVPTVDMIEIGAGGGSIARVDDLGLMKVGPESAGSNPGPACYGLGGEQPCVTDADVFLGILDAKNFLGGSMPLDEAACRRAISRLALELNVSEQQAAYGIYSLVGEAMAAAARTHATERGLNYRGLPLLAFGGAGPIHACYVAEQLESHKVIFPRMASVLSAFGTLVTPIRIDLARSNLMRLSEMDWGIVDALMSEMIAEGKEALVNAGLSGDSIGYSFSVDMRYIGQQTEVTVPLGRKSPTEKDSENFASMFEQEYQSIYGLSLDDMDIEIVAWRVSSFSLSESRFVDREVDIRLGAPKGRRSIYLGSEALTADVYDRETLGREQTLQGPCIIEERETTILILPNWRATVAKDGAVVAERMEGS
jgi:N-methylhydantoinase A